MFNPIDSNYILCLFVSHQNSNMHQFHLKRVFSMSILIIQVDINAFCVIEIKKDGTFVSIVSLNGKH